MTIYEIKRRTSETSPHFFDRSTLKFFGQTMRDFHVTKMIDGNYFVEAKAKYGWTRRIFNPTSNKLEYVSESQYKAMTAI